MRTRAVMSGMLGFTPEISGVDLISAPTEMTTSVPVMLSTNAAKTTIKVTVENAVRITTVTVPPVDVFTGSCS